MSRCIWCDKETKQFLLERNDGFCTNCAKAFYTPPLTKEVKKLDDDLLKRIRTLFVGGIAAVNIGAAMNREKIGGFKWDAIGAILADEEARRRGILPDVESLKRRKGKK